MSDIAQAGGGLASGKVALVTGAGSGIGRATAELFAIEGAATVIVADIDVDAAKDTVALIERAGGAAEAAHCNVADPESVATLVDGIIDRHGRLDAAHNNAGIRGHNAAFHELPIDDWHRMISVNLTGVFLCMQRELSVMVRQGAGAIVNTSSGAGVIGFPSLPHYVAAKHGVVGLTKTAALEYATRGIRINAVLPGMTDTPMVRSGDNAHNNQLEQMVKHMGRGTMGRPGEIADAVVWLCSDRASFVNGESMLVDGGTVCR
jgi:NAD(P)-dependent dehydrogenase (short-subunit alcohol dehydrogenase family)